MVSTMNNRHIINTPMIEAREIYQERATQNDLLKKYSTRSLSTDPSSKLPNATIGAETSPMLKSSVSEVKTYSGLKALDASWRATLLLASMSGVKVGSVQYARDSSKMVWLKMWLLPK